MKGISLGLLLAVFLVFPFVGFSQTTSNPVYVRKPKITLEDAITIGKNYIEGEKIDVKEYYMDYIRLNLNPRGDEGKFWEIRWERNEGVGKGDFIHLQIYMDKQVERIAAK